MSVNNGKNNSIYYEKVGNIYNCKLILETGKEFVIPLRENGYIFATGLCKVAGKLVGNWLRLKETKELIKTLETDTHIRISELVEIYKGGNDKYNQGTWVHPDLGLQLAQWCSPSFSLQVSKWIRELTMTQKVEIGKEKTNDEIQIEFEKIKQQLEEKIKELEESKLIIEEKTKDLEETTKKLEEKTKELYFSENKYNRFQKREKCPDDNVLYIVTAEPFEKERIYLIGKAVNMKARLTSYNKSLEHKIVYYRSFKNMYHMKTAETMALYKLNQYRDKTKRERLILPEGADISLFTNVINETFQWFENIENIVVNTISSDIEEKDLPKKRGEFESNLVYLLSSKIHLKKRTYIIGKSKNLNSRITAYEKGVDHSVVYTKKCKNKSQMAVIEAMILYRLDPFRERANRDRFILPKDKDVSFFTDIFDEAIKWFENINKELVIIKDKDVKIQEEKDNKKIYREVNQEKIFEIQKNYREKNKDVLIVKQKKYRDTHKKEVSDGKKDWYHKNRQSVIDRVQKNYENDKENKLKKVKEYASKNKEKIKAQQSITVTCLCGSTYRKYGWKKHLETMKHKESMQKLIVNPIEEIDF